MRTALVTGGTRGIGHAIVERLRHEGIRTIVTARHPPNEPDGDFIRCDISSAISVKGLFSKIKQTHGGIDILINNAGTAGANTLDGDDDLWHSIVASNLNGTYYCCKAALPMLPDGSGRIVNMASVLGLRGVPDQTAYCAAKHAVVGFTRSLALALAPRGITVNALCPGWVDTPMAHQRYKELGITPEQAAAGVPTGRIATPDEIADAVIWLLRPESRGITGHALPIEGGGLALP